MLALAALSGVGHRWVDILAQFTAPALMATLVLVAVLAVSRLWIATGAGGVVALLLLIALWPQWAPDKGTPAPDAPTISLYSANLYIGNQNADAIAASVRAADADIVVMFEANEALTPAFDRILAGYPHRLISPGVDQDRVERRIIASRWPLTAVRERADGLSDQTAVVDTPLGPVNIVGVHLTRPWPYQYQWGQITQVMALEAVLADLSGPVIVAGDFNSVSSARIGRQIQNDLGLIPASGWPGTWPAQLPPLFGITIDQVYRSPDLAFIDRRLGQRTGSDHRPVITRFTLAQPPEPARPRP
jgi:endonuclease/exonuclease/phosphatase (EEP) superfamily protein YafD